MLTLILSVKSEDTDLSMYTALLKDDDVHIIVREDTGGIVARYNEIVQSSDIKSDIVLVSDCVDIQSDLYNLLSRCLYTAEKHAIICGQEILNKKSLIEVAKKYLPYYTMTVEVNSNCALIKRDVINKLGFLDEAYNSIDYALMDFYSRINRYGYSALISHSALFSYNDRAAEKAFNDAAINEDRKLFESKYDYWMDTKELFSLHGTEPCVEFIELLDKDYSGKKRILFDCSIMPPFHCGTTEYQLSIYEAFYRLFKDKYELFIYSNYDANEFHKLTERFENVLFPDTITGVFHLGFVPNQLQVYEYQSEINRRCLKIVQTMFDIIMLRRIDEHYGINMNTNVELGLKLSDGIIFISNYSKSDFHACFNNISGIENIKQKVIYPAIEFTNPKENDYSLPFEEYILVTGNSFEHKVMKETIDVVSKTQYNYIVVGYGDYDLVHPNVYSYASGKLDDDFLSYLYVNCKAVIFPSLYEGFGLPIAIGLKNKKRVIVNNNILNKELEEHFSNFSEHLFLYDTFEQIVEIIDSIDFSQKLIAVEYTDTWDNVATELESFFIEVLNVDVDPEKLRDRWQIYKLVDAKMKDVEVKTRNEDMVVINGLRVELKQIYSQFGSYGIFRMLFFAIKEHVKNRHPRLYRIIKGK